MKIISALAVLALLTLSLVALQTSQTPLNLEQTKIEGERLYSEGSFALAREAFKKASSVAENPADKRWLAFRLADTQWRAQSGTQTADNTQYDQAREELEALLREIKRPEDRDLVWAEAQESLGDFWWTRRDSRNWSLAWTHY